MPQEIIEILNTFLEKEILATNYYLINSCLFKSQGLNKLASLMHEESLEERKHAAKLLERIFYLGGEPNIQGVKELRSFNTDVEKILEYDLKMEQNIAQAMQKAIVKAESLNDFGTADLLRELLHSEEKHCDWLETQLSLIETIGLARYLQSNL